MMYFLRQLLDIVTYPLRALLTTPSKLISGSQRLRQISLPARVAILTGVVLAILATVITILFWKAIDVTHFAKLTLAYFVIVPILVVVIPIVLYKALVLWLEGDVSPFPDIDHAWKTGLDELERQGIDLMQTPLFLILGSANEWQEKAVFDSTRFSLNVRETPKGPASLHWYGNADGVYLVCSDTSCLSKLSRLAMEVAGESSRKLSPAAELPAASSIRGTIIAERPSERDSSRTRPPEEDVPAEQAAVPRTMDIRGTMVLSHNGPEMGTADVPNVAEKRVVKLPQHDASEQERRLEYVCRLVRRNRQPLCPINGILTLLPFHLIQRSVAEAIELQRAVQRDLATLQKQLMVRCPVTALVIGLEEESGFQELVRRVGRDRALNQRFGRSFLLANPPIAERMEALCAHVCGSFEDWVYTLFREKGALSKPGNTKLYALLCKIRRNVQSRLEAILANAFGFDPDQKAKNQSLLFGGCYFAAAGDTEDRQAFVKGVFDKLPEQQEELEWMDEAIRLDQKYHSLANVSFSVSTVLLLGLAGMLIYKAFWH